MKTSSSIDIISFLIILVVELKPKDIEEFIIDYAVHMELLESFFEKRGNKSLILCFQMSDPPGPGIFSISNVSQRPKLIENVKTFKKNQYLEELN